MEGEWRKVGNTTSATWSRWALSVVRHVSSVYSLPDVMKWPSLWPSSSMQSQYNQNIRQTIIEEHYINYWPVHLEVESSHPKPWNLRKCWRPKKSRETWLLNVTRYPSRIPCCISFSSFTFCVTNVCVFCVSRIVVETKHHLIIIWFLLSISFCWSKTLLEWELYNICIYGPWTQFLYHFR